jgi:hypothetical protein
MSPETEERALAADTVIWLFGYARSGTTWLAEMMGDMPGHELWNEPLVGALFGEFYDSYQGDRRGGNFILGQAHRRVWLSSIRTMVLAGGAARWPQLSERDLLVIKEPHGCLGAPLLSEALPQSRLILLLRDPRDVIASRLDAQRKGSWTAQRRVWRGREKPMGAADKNPDLFVRNASKSYLHNIVAARQAYESHAGPKALVKYEELREDTPGVMRRMYGELGVPVQPDDVAGVVERHAWENIPPEQKGAGQFHRKATPGGWREDLTEKQVEIVEEIAHPILEEFYGEVGVAGTAGKPRQT